MLSHPLPDEKSVDGHALEARRHQVDQLPGPAQRRVRPDGGAHAVAPGPDHVGKGLQVRLVERGAVRQAGSAPESLEQRRNGRQAGAPDESLRRRISMLGAPGRC